MTHNIARLPLILALLGHPGILPGQVWQESNDTTCANSGSEYARGFLSSVKAAMDPERSSAYRSKLGLPETPASKIKYVTDAKVCLRLLDAIIEIKGVSADSLGGFVDAIAVGNYYWVENRRLMAGEWIAGFVFDSSFKLVSRPGR